MIDRHNIGIKALVRESLNAFEQARLTSPYVSAGQIWLDNNSRIPTRKILVLYGGKNSVVCQSMSTGMINTIRRVQFNRGKTGYTYAGDLSELNEVDKRSTLRQMTQSYVNHLTKLAGDSFSISIRKESR